MIIAKFRHQDCGSGGEVDGVSDAGLLCPGAEGGVCCLHTGGGQPHGASTQVLFP
ncbi:hypothetical protein DPMN_136704 [Dreissena polymorpha]|uniref:Uncharacterized protein n=1 Tax=Dreissena polymorpha TaxID=45954 RepID=A0A9D4G197_DREPO|nr:hypothetical protein DPMN_136704 [Dreissena polymorpha]